MCSIPDFDKLDYTTKTLVAYSNMNINLEKSFEYLPVIDYIVQQKKRGRKNKNIIENLNEGIPVGSIISIRFNGKLRGVNLKKEKKTKIKRQNCFPNSMNIKMILDYEKKIDFKLTNKGISMTGFTEDKQHIKVFYYLYKHFVETQELIGEPLFTFVKNELFTEDYLILITKVVMKNYSFNIGSRISSNNLYEFIINHGKYKISYKPDNSAQVIIKLPARNGEEESMLECAKFIDNKIIQRDKIKMKYVDDILEVKKPKNKEKEYTFMMFHSGSCTMTGNSFKEKEVYNEFKEFIEKNFESFKEVIDEV